MPNFPEKLESFAKKGSVLVGDVHPDVVKVAGAFTPVPGGVGPLTIAMLMSNTVKAAREAARCGRRRGGGALMLRAGLTGGIATGKSVVAAMMRELGCYVLDADRMAHRLIEPGQAAYRKRRAANSAAVFWTTKDSVVRAKLAEIVFADPARLARLNAIIHPHVLAGLDRELGRLAQSDAQGVAVVEAALLIESGYSQKLDRLVVVWCTPEQQLERLISGRGMTEEQARRRIASQMSLDEKRKLADDEIDCSGTMDHTRKQVIAVVERLKQIAVAA